MTQPLDKAYDPQAVQEEVAKRWEEANAFHAVPDPSAEPYAIVIPPPNVTAALHMGHALNNTLQDILIRWRRMAGDNAVWLPGTDHAGIATQTVVEKRVLAEEGKRRTDFPRDEFVAKIQAWKDEYEARITHQLKEMGCSCDYDRQRFTMDPVCAAAVREAFFRLFKDGLIYRGKRLVNWDPATQTALADDEVEMREVDGSFWYMKYPIVEFSRDPAGSAPPQSKIKNQKSKIQYLTVATTRPETMLGDTAVAVNPSDPERAKFIGQHVRLPIVNRVIPIVGDDYVVVPDPDSDDAKAKYASGFLKVTPAHDPNDYEIGQRHDLPVLNVMAPDASISKDHGWPEGDFAAADPFAAELLGTSREDARTAIVDWFEKNDLLAETRPYRHAVGHSYRSHVPVEPYLSDQWYVKVTDDRLAGAALRAMAEDQRAESEGCVWKEGGSFESAAEAHGLQSVGSGGANAHGQLRFHPPRYAKTFQTWHENLRDWCISRQLWWGHRIPVWSAHMSQSEMEDSFGPLREKSALKRSIRNINVFAPMFRLMENFLDTSDDFEKRNLGWCTVAVRDNGDLYRLAGHEEVRSECKRLYADVPADEELSWYICSQSDNYDLITEIEANGFEQDPDVLDTWFSSALWPISTLGWPDPAAFPEEFPEGDAALNRWNPSSTLCTAREIITLWVSRMVMFNTYFRGRLPFTDVFIHAMIQDGQGQKMSKSLGNGVDPLDIIHSHGADAMRFTLAAMTTHTQDVGMPVQAVCPHTGEPFEPRRITTPAGHVVAAPIQECPSDPSKKMVTSYGQASGEARPTADMPLARNTSPKFDHGRNFANKLWNAGRFVLSNLEGGVGEAHGLQSMGFTSGGLADRWILSRLAETSRRVNAALETYRFNEYAQLLYDFFWRDLCDWHLEAIKPIINTGTPEGTAARRTLAACFDAVLRMLHPVMPYVTEKLWWSLHEVAADRSAAGLDLPPSDLCIRAAWPGIDAAALNDPDAERRFERVVEIVTAIRNIRNQYAVPPRQTVTTRIRAAGDAADALSAATPLIETLAACAVAAVGGDAQPAEDAAVAVVGDAEVYVEGLIDRDAERDRLTRRFDELGKSRNALRGRLSNPGYTEKAPARLVQQTRDQLTEAEREMAIIEEKLRGLGAAG